MILRAFGGGQGDFESVGEGQGYVESVGEGQGYVESVGEGQGDFESVGGGQGVFESVGGGQGDFERRVVVCWGSSGSSGTVSQRAKKLADRTHVRRVSTVASLLTDVKLPLRLTSG